MIIFIEIHCLRHNSWSSIPLYSPNCLCQSIKSSVFTFSTTSSSSSQVAKNSISASTPSIAFVSGFQFCSPMSWLPYLITTLLAHGFYLTFRSLMANLACFNNWNSTSCWRRPIQIILNPNYFLQVHHTTTKVTLDYKLHPAFVHLDSTSRQITY